MIGLTAHPADAGSLDTFTYSWSVLRDGADFALPQGTDTTSADLNFTPTNDGEYVATVTITDKDGGSVDVATGITVTNVAPTATISGAPGSSINEGDAVNL